MDRPKIEVAIKNISVWNNLVNHRSCKEDYSQIPRLYVNPTFSDLAFTNLQMLYWNYLQRNNVF